MLSYCEKSKKKREIQPATFDSSSIFFLPLETLIISVKRIDL